MALNRRRFVAWVERRMLAPGAVPARFELVHVVRGGGRSLVCTLAPLKGAADDAAEALAGEVHDEAIDHVEAWSGRQNYVVRALADDGREVGEFAFFQTANSVVHTHAAHELGELTPEQDAIASGPARIPEQMGGHPTAMVATQLMRHTEGLVRHLVEVTSMQRERDAQIIRSQQASIDKHEQQHFALMELMEGMLCRQQERALVQAEHDADESRKERLFTRVNELVIPAFAEKLGMPKAVSGAVNGALAEMREIFFALPEEQQTAVLKALPEDKQDKFLLMLGKQEEGTKH